MRHGTRPTVHNGRVALSAEPAARYPAPREDPLLYPGSRPSGSFVLAEESVFPLTFPAHPAPAADRVGPGDRTGLPVDEFLIARGGAPLAERFPVIGYGSNPVPGQLVSKFGREAVVPVIAARLSGSDVVYNLISNAGYAFAELTLDEAESTAQVGVTFLDAEQLRRMRETEQNYRLAINPRDLELDSGEILSAQAGASYTFAGFRPIWVPRRYSGPVPIAELPSAGRSRPALTQRQVLALAIEEFGLRGRGLSSPEELARLIRNEADLPEEEGKLKVELQARISADPRSHPPVARGVELVEGSSLPRRTYGHRRRAP